MPSWRPGPLISLEHRAQSAFRFGRRYPRNSRSCAAGRWPRIPVLISWFAIFPFFLWPFVLGRAQVQYSRSLASTPRTGEVDTAARGGQAGGKALGINYQLKDLRCSAGQAIVGLNLRRGDALDWLQVACAKPVCTGGNCQWSASQWGPSAGDPSGGDAHPPMVCANNQAVSGFRARVVTFFYRTYDYAEDVEIECSQIVAAPTASGFVQVAQSVSGQTSAPTWLHPEGGIGLDTIIPRWASTFISPIISCARRGWAASAFSLGISDFVSSRVVQAVSLYCPAGQPSTAPTAPTLIDRCVDLQKDPLQLLVDSQLRKRSQTGYNCFYYLRTFIERSEPQGQIFQQSYDFPNQTEIEGPRGGGNYRYLENHGYQQLAKSRSLQTFPAQIGDVVTVESPPYEQAGFPYLHGAIVVEVSANGQIVRLRQKTSVDKCVRDLDPVTFMTQYYGLPAGSNYNYELWRNPQSGGLPRAN